jgi:hypothetical protein
MGPFKQLLNITHIARGNKSLPKERDFCYPQEQGGEKKQNWKTRKDDPVLLKTQVICFEKFKETKV